MSLGKCKLKQRQGTTAHLLKWPKPGTSIVSNADEGVQQQKQSYISGGNEKWSRHF